MRIGNGKQGVEINEYSVAEQVGKSRRKPDTNPVIGYVEPACKNPQWILWFHKNGDALLYTRRAPGGAVVGDPIRISAKRGTETTVVNRTKSVRVLKQEFSCGDFDLRGSASSGSISPCIIAGRPKHQGSPLRDITV